MTLHGEERLQRFDSSRGAIVNVGGDPGHAGETLSRTWTPGWMNRLFTVCSLGLLWNQDFSPQSQLSPIIHYNIQEANFRRAETKMCLRRNFCFCWRLSALQLIRAPPWGTVRKWCWEEEDTLKRFSFYSWKSQHLCCRCSVIYQNMNQLTAFAVTSLSILLPC